MVTAAVFVIFYLIPGSPLHMTAMGISDAQAENRIATELHLDVSLYQQYWIFLWNIVRHASLGYWIGFTFGGQRWLKTLGATQGQLQEALDAEGEHEPVHVGPTSSD